MALFQPSVNVNIFITGTSIFSNVACEDGLFGALNPILNVKENDDVDFTIPFPAVKVNTVS